MYSLGPVSFCSLFLHFINIVVCISSFFIIAEHYPTVLLWNSNEKLLDLLGQYMSSYFILFVSSQKFPYTNQTYKTHKFIIYNYLNFLCCSYFHCSRNIQMAIKNNLIPSGLKQCTLVQIDLEWIWIQLKGQISSEDFCLPSVMAGWRGRCSFLQGSRWPGGGGVSDKNHIQGLCWSFAHWESSPLGIRMPLPLTVALTGPHQSLLQEGSCAPQSPHLSLGPI